jgi:topoisomerase-4 subunit A
VEQDLSEIVPYAMKYLRSLLRKYGSEYPRRTHLAAFEAISERELTANELTIHYDREKGYIGYGLEGEPLISCSPLDRLLLVWKDGRCKVVAPPEKLFVDKTLIYCAILERERVLTVVYELDFFTHFKKFQVGGLNTNRESRIAPRGAHIRFFTDEDPAALYVRYAQDPRIKIRQQKFAVERQPLRSRDAKGSVLTANMIEYVGGEKADDWDDDLTGPPGKFIDA